VQDAEGPTFDSLAKYNIVTDLNTLFCQSKEDHVQLWDVVAEELHNLFGPLCGTTIQGHQLFEELNQFPLGVVLMFLRVSEQMGFQWENRVQVTLLDASVAWISENKASVVSVRDLQFSYIGVDATSSLESISRVIPKGERPPDSSPDSIPPSVVNGDGGHTPGMVSGVGTPDLERSLHVSCVSCAPRIACIVFMFPHYPSR
jgi:hypothetical protein